MSKPLERAQSRWSQPALFPVGANGVSVEVTFYIDGSSDPAMVGYECRARGVKRPIVAAGLVWCQNWRDREQWTEIVADIFKEVTEHLSPF